MIAAGYLVRKAYKSHQEKRAFAAYADGAAVPIALINIEGSLLHELIADLKPESAGPSSSPPRLSRLLHAPLLAEHLDSTDTRDCQ